MLWLLSCGVGGKRENCWDKENIERIKSRKVCTIDDVVSTGETMNALKNLVFKSGGKLLCEAAVWLEGPWYKGDLIYLATLPVFVSEEKMQEILRSYNAV